MKTTILTICALAISLSVIACNESATTNSNVKTVNSASSNANTNSAAPAADKAAIESDLKKLMDTAQTALPKGDADAMDKVYADDYVLVNVDGSVQTKAERLASLRSGEAKYSSFAYSEPNVRINPEGNGAVIIAKLTMKGTFKGKSMDGDYRVTQVYSKTKDGWRQVSAQATQITGDTAKTADTKADDKVANVKKEGDKPAANK